MCQDEGGKGQGPEDGKERDPGASEVATSRSTVVGPLAPGQRWTVTKKREVVLRIFRGESLDSLSRELGVEIYRLEKWRDTALGGIDVALKSRTEDPLQAEYDSAIKRVGELTMENELLWQRVRQPGPLAKRRSKK
jgi:transposase